MQIPQECLEAVATAARRADALGWAEATAGNLSLLVDAERLGGAPRWNPLPPDAGLPSPRLWPRHRCLLISGTRTRMREIAQDPAAGLSVVACDGERYVVASTCVPPSSELPVHLAVMARREPGSLLLHVHPDFLIALSHLTLLRAEGALSRALLPLMPETRIFLGRGIARIEYEHSGSAALGSRSAAALAEADVLVWDRHGALAVGENAAQALDRLELAEKAARVWWIARRTGEIPRGLPAALFAELDGKLDRA